MESSEGCLQISSLISFGGFKLCYLKASSCLIATLITITPRNYRSIIPFEEASIIELLLNLCPDPPLKYSLLIRTFTAMNERIKRSLFGGVIFGVLFTLFLLTRVPIDKAVSLGFVSFVLISGSVYFFYVPPKRRDESGREAPNQLDNGEKILLQEGASHLWKGDTVGGTLYLTASFLMFKAHSFSLRKHQLTIPVKDIEDIEEDAHLGVNPSGIKLKLDNGQIIKIQVKSRDRWIARVTKLIEADN